MGKRTIFNLLGPLANPAGTKVQLLGVYDRALLVPFAEALKALGSKRAWIVHGADGLDEITTTGETYIAALDEDGSITERMLTPKDFGLEPSTPDKITGGEAEENAKALRAILEGQQCAYQDIVIANAAAVLHLSGKAETLTEGAAKARAALENNEANELLRDYVVLSRTTADEREAL